MSFGGTHKPGTRPASVVSKPAPAKARVQTSETLKSWSISRAQTFDACAYRAKLQWVDKIPDNMPRPAADRGTQIHQEAEDYVTKGGEFTHNLRHFKDDLLSLKEHHKKGRVTCEEEWAFDQDWQVTDWKAGWLRLKLDAMCMMSPTHAAVIDYKTGARFGNEIKHSEQLQIYALTTLLRYPSVELVTAELWYLDQNEMADLTMKRSQLKRFLQIFDRKGKAITEETRFKPNPNIFSCKYCPYHESKQGDCEYGVASHMLIKKKKAD